jgi:branched-chain amino acid transport system substrate-binding protein
VQFSKSARCLLIVTTLLAAALLAVACGEEEEEAAETPEATAAEPTETAEEVPGVTDTEILLGTHLPLSGSPASAYAPIGDGMRSYFEYINDVEGGVYGRKIKLLIEDDHYNPPDTMEVVRKLVEQDEVFAIVGGLGEETHKAVWKYLEEEGVPDMFLSTGLRQWTRPVVRTRFGYLPEYQMEGQMLGMYIAENYDGKKLGLLLQNDDLGKEGEEGLRIGLEGSDVEISAIEKYEAMVFDVTAQTQRLKNADVDVIAAYAMPPQAASLVKTARETLTWDVPILASSIVQSDIFIELAGAENAEGVISVVFGLQIYQTDEPGVQQHLENMEKYAPGTAPSNFTLYGSGIAELMVECLKRAGPDLTRDSLIDGCESIRDHVVSLAPESLPINMSSTDHRPVEVEIYNRVENGKWVTFGEPVGFETTPTE